jgi:putative molybdopterin biosynthesis protein
VRDGAADVGLGIQAAAVRYGLDFVPLEEERYDLLIPDEEYDSPLLAPLLSHLQGATFRHTLSALPGYSARHLGATHKFAA